MNDFPRQILHRIVAKYGKEICDDARRCEGLLNDLCGNYRREINVLVNAIEERIPLDLLAGVNLMPPELLLTRLEIRLEDQTGLTAEAARWAVESWALALGIMIGAEIEERQRKQSIPPSVKAGTFQPTESENKAANPNVANINRANPPSKVTLPGNRHSTKISLPSPPVHLPTNNQPIIQTPSANPQLQPSNQIVVSKSRFGVIRGCLLVIFLLALTSLILFLGVPYAIDVMRETQRERNDEPPRFPVR